MFTLNVFGLPFHNLLLTIREIPRARPNRFLINIVRLWVINSFCGSSKLPHVVFMQIATRNKNRNYTHQIDLWALLCPTQKWHQFIANILLIRATEQTDTQQTIRFDVAHRKHTTRAACRNFNLMVCVCLGVRKCIGQTQIRRLEFSAPYSRTKKGVQPISYDHSFK